MLSVNATAQLWCPKKLKFLLLTDYDFDSATNKERPLFQRKVFERFLSCVPQCLHWKHLKLRSPIWSLVLFMRLMLLSSCSLPSLFLVHKIGFPNMVTGVSGWKEEAFLRESLTEFHIESRRKKIVNGSVVAGSTFSLQNLFNGFLCRIWHKWTNCNRKQRKHGSIYCLASSVLRLAFYSSASLITDFSPFHLHFCFIFLLFPVAFLSFTLTHSLSLIFPLSAILNNHYEYALASFPLVFDNQTGGVFWQFRIL